MKKIIVSIVIMLSLLPTTTFAGEQQPARIAGDFHITYNGVEQSFTDGNGKPVTPIEVAGTTYLPVRAVSNLAGLNVGWDEPTNTVSLTSGGVQSTYDGVPNASVERITVEPDPTLTITMDGIAQTFKDGNGKVVYPFVYEGTTYLPVRAVCNLVNIPVDWDATTQTVILGTKPETGKPAEIPAGAKVLTGDDILPPTIISDVYYKEGAFYIQANGYVSRDIGIDFINDGYKTVTFTVTTDDAYDKANHTVEVCELDSLYGTALTTDEQEYGVTRTYTANISGVSKVGIRVGAGLFANAVLTNVYLTK